MTLWIGRKERVIDLNRLEGYKSVERLRKEAHLILDSIFDKLLLSVHGMDKLAEERRIVPLVTDPARFKGEKPSALYFPDGQRIETNTWRKLVKTILEDCGAIPECRERLKQWGQVLHGPQRWVVHSDPSEMNVPLKIADGLYFEGYFDTEFLFRQLTQALELAGYDYTGLAVELREPVQEQTVEVEQSESADDFDMRM